MNDPLSDILPYLPYLLAAGLVGLFAYVEYLRGRIDKQTEIINAIINAIKRLEKE